MKHIKVAIAAFMIALGVVATPVVTVGAIDPLAGVCTGNSTSEVCGSKDESAGTLIANVVSTLLFIVGALSVVMIIYSGILYAISSGDSGKVAKAKNTLTYSIVGLVVSLLAYAIVSWVLNVL